MRNFTSLIIILSFPFLSYSQTYEVGGLLGGMNYIGDIGTTTYINPNTIGLGGLFKWNRSERHSFRGSILLAKIKGDDTNSDEARRAMRGYEFENSILEISAGLEYTFWEFNMYSGEAVSTPYIYTGLTYMRYNALYKRPSDLIVEYDKAGAVAIPMVVGYKAAIGAQMVLGVELGARYTFTDDLDGSNPVKGLAKDDSLKFGNINSNDWYVFTGMTLTFTFGRKPCYCNF